MQINNRHIAIFWLYLVVVHFCFWFTILHRFYILNAGIPALIIWILRNEIPIITLCSLYLEPPELKIRKPFYLIWILSISFIAYGIFTDSSFLQLTGFNWRYHAVLTYLFFGLIYFEILRRKTTEFKAFGISLVLCIIAGMLYEFPLYFFSVFGGLYHVSFITIINPRFVVLPFLGYLFFKSKWKWEPERSKFLFMAYFIFWLIVELLYPAFKENFYYSLLVRIPSLILILIAIKYLERL